MNIVGKGIAKIDGMSIATGKPVYTDDLAAKEALVVKILRSPHPYAIIEEIDTIVNSRQNKELGEKEKVILSELLNFLDGPSSPDSCIIIATTNHIEKLDPAIIRSGRFDIKIDGKG